MSEHPIDPAMPLDRLDLMLVASGLVESRSKAQRLIKAGHVRVDGEAITKPSFMVKAGHCELAVDKGDDYVSRGAYKLLGAFKAFADDGLTGPQSAHPPVDLPMCYCAGERPESWPSMWGMGSLTRVLQEIAASSK
jgi:ribosomal 50S subunit-recycling heat shock protein